METVFDRLEKELIQRCLTQGRQEGLEEGRQEGRQEGVAEFVLRQLRLKVGILDRATKDRIRSLPVDKLAQLGESLLDFKSKDDLEKWMRRNAPAAKRARRANGTKSQARKKPGRN